jgi:hypothetical protein
MRRKIVAAVMACASIPLPAHAAIRAVFVGIDKYLYSKPKVPESQFRDLSGAVHDTGTIKAALREAYGLNLDSEVDGQCQSSNPVSITLTDTCATKAAIMAAWDAQIEASQPGDTLILYYAGHGSRFIDNQSGEQATLHNSTILATDAREPLAESSADILDREIRQKIDRATAKGVRVVSIFDSCNSGTATRSGEGENRTAPALVVKGLQPVAATSYYGGLGAYRVHLAAAADDEEAKEVGGVGARAGVFTSALASTLIAMRGASFADIAAAVRLKVAAGNPRQNPQAEGALRATLGGEEVRVPLFDAVRSGSDVILAGGTLTGVTAGSTFALFPSTSAALPGDTRPLATGRVTQLDASLATLSLDPPAPPDLPGRLIAREVQHVFGTAVISVRNDAGNPQIAAALAALPFVGTIGGAELSVSVEGGATILASENGARIARLPAPGDPAFGWMLSSALQKVARVNALLSVRPDPAGGAVDFCIRNASADFDVATCPPEARGGRALKLYQPAIISVINSNDDPRFIYVLGIDQEYSVTLLLPPNGAVDPAVAARQPLRVPDGQEISPSDPGLYHFVTIATDAPINARVLEQTSAGTRDVAACLTALARELCTDAETKREGAMPRVTRWTATVSNAIVR